MVQHARDGKARHSEFGQVGAGRAAYVAHPPIGNVVILSNCFLLFPQSGTGLLSAIMFGVL